MPARRLVAVGVRTAPGGRRLRHRHPRPGAGSGWWGHWPFNVITDVARGSRWHRYSPTACVSRPEEDSGK